MIEQIIVISLIVTAIHVSMRDDMIFGGFKMRLSNLLDALHLSVLKRPLYECNICMGGVWTCVLYPILYGFNWYLFPVMLGVIGANVVIAAILKYLYYDSEI